ncbi:MAG: hypothetical protein HQM03_01660 [Magnetococcales bacterium]|nr:hypothetical protein [Magnetococcales bacterium]
MALLFALPTSGLCVTNAPLERLPPAEPLPRVETGMHSGQIRHIAVDNEERFLFSVAEDKTLRVWSLRTGKPVLTFRVPIGLTNEGALYSLAFSPDGRTVAVSGQTGQEWEDNYCIYLIDVRSGVIRRRILNVPEAITHMAFSRNGSYLATVFANKEGLRVYGIPDGALVYQSEPYQVPANWVDFAPDGKLVVSGYDGAVRLYDANFRLLMVKQLARNAQPHGVAFSPDGGKVAVGFRDRPTVAVLSGTDLSLLYFPEVTGVAHNLWTVAWSADGRTLYAGGSHADKGRTLIRIWGLAGEPNHKGRGEYIDVAATHATIMHILPLKNGGLVFAAADPTIGVLDNQGFPIFIKESTLLNFKGNAMDFRVSQLGDVVEFSADKGRQQFSVSQLLLNGGIPAQGLSAPRLQSAEIRVAGGGEAPVTFNGRPMELDRGETLHALAMDPRERFFVLGTSRHLRFYTKNGHAQWTVATPAPVWAVNVSGNSAWVVAALEDGTIRWYDVMRGDEKIALFVHKDLKHWVIWSSLRYFAYSADAESLLGWHLNRGKAQLADFQPTTHFPHLLQPDFFKNFFR